MIFNSIEFFVFISVFVPFFYLVCDKESWRDSLLLAGSYLFYMSWYWQYASLILISTVVDFLVGKQMDKKGATARQRKGLLLISLTVNLGILAYFKYNNFFIDASKQGLALLGIDMPELYHQLLLPVGISFYTFQTLSYSIDLYRRNISHENSFVKFAVFVSFFPQLVAGPIVRAKDFLPQLHEKLNLTKENVNLGSWLIFLGLFKKIVIADLLAYLVVDSVFENPSMYSSWDLLVGLYAYAFQIYCDFSGYSDIAIGIALILGFHLPINFNRPYLAQTPSDFWKRWHISLSSWLRDYLYISLGGNRGGGLFTARNLLLTMLLGGLWHGAAWNFVLWGAFHGVILVLSRNVRVETVFGLRMVSKVFLMFHFVLFSWLLFRVPDMATFTSYTDGLAKLTLGSQLSSLVYVLIAMIGLVHFTPKRWLNENVFGVFTRTNYLFQAGCYCALLFVFIGASIDSGAFIYFQF